VEDRGPLGATGDQGGAQCRAEGARDANGCSHDVEINVRAADYPGRNVADGDTLTTISWVFDGGSLHGQPVFETLRDYLRHVSGLIEEAERRLGS
jgi:hypothetical protein